MRQASTWPVRILRMAGLLLVLAIASAPAVAGDPPKGVFIYTISRNGQPVGQQRLEFVSDGSRLRVLSHTELDVNFMGLNLYGFDQQVEEVRDGDRIVALTSEADDDGTEKKVQLKLEGDRLQGDYNGDTPRKADPKLKTSLFWAQPPLGETRVLDCLRGKVREVHVADAGTETLRLPAGAIEAHHLKVTGEMKRDLWYDAGGILVAGQLKGPDGSVVRQELLQRP